MIWSCVLGAGTVAVCGLAGREIAGRRVGLLAAALAAIYPNVWVHDGMLALRDRGALHHRCAAPLRVPVPARPERVAGRVARVSGAASRAWPGPSSVLALPLVLAPLVLLRRDRPWRQRLLWLGAGTLATAICITPWLGYNLSRFDRPVYMSDNFGSTLGAANCKATYYGADIGYKNYDCARVLAQHFTRTVPHWSTLDESERDFVFRKAALTYIKAHKQRVPFEVAARWVRIAGLYHPTQEIDRQHVPAQAAGMAGLPPARQLLPDGGPRDHGRGRHAPAVDRHLAAGRDPGDRAALRRGTFAQTRYRAPAEIAFVLAAAVAIDAGITVVRRRSEPAMNPSSRPWGPPDGRDRRGPPADPAARAGSRASTGLRALAALSVLLTHVAFASGANSASILGVFFARMDGGVAVFFVLSGFLLYRPFILAHVRGRPRRPRARSCGGGSCASTLRTGWSSPSSSTSSPTSRSRRRRSSSSTTAC